MKSANVLLDGTKTIAKLADLGMSRIQIGTHATATVVSAYGLYFSGVVVVVTNTKPTVLGVHADTFL